MVVVEVVLVVVVEVDKIHIISSLCVRGTSEHIVCIDKAASVASCVLFPFRIRFEFGVQLSLGLSCVHT